MDFFLNMADQEERFEIHRAEMRNRNLRNWQREASDLERFPKQRCFMLLHETYRHEVSRRKKNGTADEKTLYDLRTCYLYLKKEMEYIFVVETTLAQQQEVWAKLNVALQSLFVWEESILVPMETVQLMCYKAWDKNQIICGRTNNGVMLSFAAAAEIGEAKRNFLMLQKNFTLDAWRSSKNEKRE